MNNINLTLHYTNHEQWSYRRWPLEEECEMLLVNVKDRLPRQRPELILRKTEFESRNKKSNKGRDRPIKRVEKYKKRNSWNFISESVNFTKLQNEI